MLIVRVVAWEEPLLTVTLPNTVSGLFSVLLTEAEVLPKKVSGIREKSTLRCVDVPPAVLQPV